ncbi:MAG TPA: calcium/proton exchanger [Actinomycetota bacterium]
MTSAQTSARTAWSLDAFTRSERFVMLGALLLTVLLGVLQGLGAGAVVRFAVAAVALALLAAVVGDAVEQLGARLTAGATGVLQSALGNLPELFFGYFALRQNLVDVVRATLIGSILANNLLVLGLAFTVGGLRHGTQRFQREAPRLAVTLMMLAVSALILPTLAVSLHTPASTHIDGLSIACALVLLGVFIATIPSSLRAGPVGTPVTRAESAGSTGGGAPAADQEAHRAWPLSHAVAVLLTASVAAALVSDWFVDVLTPATQTLHLSQTFTGLVIVAIAGNAVENVVGVQFAARNQADQAVSVILNSPLQIALALGPILVLASFLLGTAHLTLVLPPLLVVTVALATLLPTLIVFDGESTWLEGLALIGLYGVIAASFWWG